MEKAEYKAFFIGIGAKKEIDIPKTIERNAANVTSAYQFLSSINQPGLGPAVDVKGKKVLILGGGDTAVDCARAVVRRGAREVTCVYRESEEKRPGSKREYVNAMEEGVKMVESFTPERFNLGKDGNVKEVQFVGVDCAVADENGHIIFKEIFTRKKTLKTDLVIISFGFVTELPAFIKETNIETDAMNRIKVNSIQMTSVSGVFAGGDIVRGSSLVVWALRDGREAAFGIKRYLGLE